MTMLRFLTAGESHGPCLTAIIEGLPAGLAVEASDIDVQLARRQRGYGRSERMQVEKDRVQILGGVLHGRTVGGPVAIQIANRDWQNWRSNWQSGNLPPVTVPRPGHADFAGVRKYGLDDARMVLERASARETAARVAVGAAVRQLLGHFGIWLGSYVSAIGGVVASVSQNRPEELCRKAEQNDVRCPDPAAADRMRMAIDSARGAGDTLGGVFVLVASDVPVGLGSYSQWDRRLDARLAAAVMSVPGVKGVEIGEAFDNAHLAGSRVHDAMHPGPDGAVKRATNRAGGVEGGVTNGEQVLLRAAMKPISTMRRPIDSVDLRTGQAAVPSYQRSDVCAVPAAAVVGEAMMAWELSVALVERYGGDTLTDMLRCATSS